MEKLPRQKYTKEYREQAVREPLIELRWFDGKNSNPPPLAGGGRGRGDGN